MKVSSVLDVIGGLLTIALVATILNKPNTAKDIQAGSTGFATVLNSAKA